VGKALGTAQRATPAVAVSAEVAGRENEILAPLLAQDPDTIRFTSYEEL
jgi:hypothetical protein